MEAELTYLFLKYGLATIVMALIVLIIVGIVKIFTKGVVEKKVVSDKAKQLLPKIYLGLALVISYIVCLIYNGVVLKVNCWTIECIEKALIVWTVTSPLYQLYKQFGGRKLLVAVAKLFKGKNKNTDEIIDNIENILDEEEEKTNKE